MNAEDITAAIREAIGSSTIATAADELGQQVGKERGIKLAVEQLERLVRSSWVSADLIP